MVIAFLILAALICAPAWGQDAAWDRVAKLAIGDRIQVLQREGDAVEGQFRGLSADHLSIAKGNEVRSIPLDAIKQVSIRRKASRLKASGIGGAIGFGIGFPIGASSAGYLADQNTPSIRTRAGFGAGLGLFTAGIGAGIGALAGGSHFDTVYRSR